MVWVVAMVALIAHHCITNLMKLQEAGTAVTLGFLRLSSIAIIDVNYHDEAFEIVLILGFFLYCLAI